MDARGEPLRRSITGLTLVLLLIAPPALAGDEEAKGEVETTTEQEPAGEVELLEGAVAPAPSTAPEPQVEMGPKVPEAARLIGDALDRILALEVLLATTDEGLRGAEAAIQLERARASLRAALVEVGQLQQDVELRAWLIAQGVVPDPDEAPPVEVVVVEEPPGVPADRFAVIVASVEDVSFTEGKMQVLTRELETQRITTDQASTILELFSFSRDRVEALVFLHPRILDPENFEGLLSALKFESDRETVRSQLGLDG
jgi:hypothetical protein